MMTIRCVLGQFFVAPLLNSESCRALFDSLAAASEKLLPVRYGKTEPLRNSFSVDAIVADWDDAVFWRGKSPATLGTFWPRDYRNPHDIIYLDVAGGRWSEILATLQEIWATQFPTYFGYVHAVSRAHVALPEYASRIMPLGQGLAWRDIEKRLPCVAWSMWFGPEYVQRIGRNKLLNAPVHRVSESESGICLRMSESAQLLIDDYEVYRKLRDVLVRYLGPDVVAPVDETTSGAP